MEKQKLIVSISETEMLTINMFANLRAIGSRAWGVKDGKFADKSGSEIDFDGLLGEYAFCRQFNLFYDMMPVPRAGSYDCMYNDKRIDIKSTRYSTGVLIGKEHRNPDVDIFVLAILDLKKHGADVYFPGYALADELYKEKNLTFLKPDDKSPVYALSQSELIKF